MAPQPVVPEANPFKRPPRIPKRLTGEARCKRPAQQLRSHVISIRLNEADYQKVKQLTRQEHASISAYCREMALRKKIKEIPTDLHRERWMQLGLLGAQLLDLKESAPDNLENLVERTVTEIKALRAALFGMPPG